MVFIELVDNQLIIKELQVLHLIKMQNFFLSFLNKTTDKIKKLVPFCNLILKLCVSIKTESDFKY